MLNAEIGWLSQPHSAFFSNHYSVSDSLMNTRASQIERPKSAESFSDGTVSFSSRPDWSVDPSSAISDPDQTQGELRDSVYDVGKGVQANAESPKVEPVSQALLQSVWSRIPFCLIGILLSATAIAKLWMLLTDSFADIRVGLPKEVLWLSVAFEFWLAYENFRLRDCRVMAFVNTLVFASFAIFSSVRLAMGFGTCGCSGSLELPAWIFIFIDVGVVVCFTRFTVLRKMVVCGWRNKAKKMMSSNKDLGFVSGIAIFCGFLVIFQPSIFATIESTVIGKYPIEATILIDKEIRIGHETIVRAKVSNSSRSSARIVGVSRSCQCLQFADDPYSQIIPANGHILISIRVKPEHVGLFHQRAVLYLDHPKQFRLNVDAVGLVRGEVK